MTMLLEIKPEVQAALSRQAAAQGVDVGAYAANLLEEAVHAPAVSANRPSRSLREVFETIRGLADDIEFDRNPSTGRPLDLA